MGTFLVWKLDGKNIFFVNFKKNFILAWEIEYIFGVELLWCSENLQRLWKIEMYFIWIQNVKKYSEPTGVLFNFIQASQDLPKENHHEILEKPKPPRKM